MKATCLTLTMLCMALLGTVRGNSLIRIPVCNPQGGPRFDSAINDAQSSINCGRDKCCSRSFLDNNRAVLTCNANANLCFFKTPLIGRSSLNTGASILIIMKCSDSRSGCRFSQKSCTSFDIMNLIRKDPSLKRVICAWDTANFQSPAKCIEIDLSGPEVSARGQSCRKFMGNSVIKKICELILSRTNPLCSFIRG